MVDVISFAESGAKAPFGLRGIDVLGVSLGLILGQFFTGLANLITTIITVFFIRPIRGVGEFAGSLVNVVSGAQVPVVADAAAQTALAIQQTPSFALLVGIGIVLVSAFVLSRAVRGS